MPRYSVPVVINITGNIIVNAPSKKAAIDKAKKFRGASAPKGMLFPCIDYDYPPDIGDVEVTEEELSDGPA